VGFGSLPEQNKYSRLYTTVHVLIGATAAVAVVGYFTTKAIDRKDTLRDQLKMKHQLQKDVKAGVITQEEADEDLVMIKLKSRGTLASGALFVAWVIVGSVFAMMTQAGWDADSALEFSVTALSTGGLNGLETHPSYCSPHKQIYDEEAIFCGLYILMGIPIMGMFMGKLADDLTDNYLSAQEEDHANNEDDARDIHPDELSTLHEVQALKLGEIAPKCACIRGEGQAQPCDLTFWDFVLLQAFEDDMFDAGFLQLMKHKYNQLDVYPGDSASKNPSRIL